MKLIPKYQRGKKTKHINTSESKSSRKRGDTNTPNVHDPLHTASTTAPEATKRSASSREISNKRRQTNSSNKTATTGTANSSSKGTTSSNKGSASNKSEQKKLKTSTSSETYSKPVDNLVKKSDAAENTNTQQNATESTNVQQSSKTPTYGKNDRVIMQQRLASPGYMDMLNLNLIHPITFRMAERGVNPLKLNIGDMSYHLGTFDLSLINEANNLKNILSGKKVSDATIYNILNGYKGPGFATLLSRGSYQPIASYIHYSGNTPDIQSIIAHEEAHSLGVPNDEGAALAREAFDFSQLDSKRYGDILDSMRYFGKANGNELNARGTQIKNYLGIVDDTPITGELLKLVAENYIHDTGINNNMDEFFDAIKDWDKAAKFISKYAPAVVGGVAGTAALVNGSNDLNTANGN